MCMKAQKLWLKVCDVLTRLTDTFPQISLSEVLFVEYFYLFLFQSCNSCCSCKSCIFHQFSEWILHVSEICIPKTAFWTATEILICTNDIVGGQPHQCSVEHSSQLLFPQFSPPLLCTASSLLRIIVHFQDYKWNTQKRRPENVQNYRESVRSKPNKEEKKCRLQQNRAQQDFLQQCTSGPKKVSTLVPSLSLAQGVFFNWYPP